MIPVTKDEGFAMKFARVTDALYMYERRAVVRNVDSPFTAVEICETFMNADQALYDIMDEFARLKGFK